MEDSGSLENFCRVAYGVSPPYQALCKVSIVWVFTALGVFFSYFCIKTCLLFYRNMKSEESRFFAELREGLLSVVNRTVCRLITRSSCLNFSIFCLFLLIAIASTPALFAMDAIALVSYDNQRNMFAYILTEIPVNIFQCCPFFIVMFSLEVTNLKAASALDPTNYLRRIEFAESERRKLISFIMKKSLIVTGILFLALQSMALYVELDGDVLDDSQVVYTVFKIVNYTILTMMSTTQFGFLSVEKEAQKISIEVARNVHREHLLKKSLADLELDAAGLIQIVTTLKANRARCLECNNEKVPCVHNLEKLISRRFESSLERLKLQVENADKNAPEPLLSNPRSTALWLKIAIVLLAITYVGLDLCALANFVKIISSQKEEINGGFFGWVRTCFETMNMLVISITVPILINEHNIFGDHTESFIFWSDDRGFSKDSEYYSLETGLLNRDSIPV